MNKHYTAIVKIVEVTKPEPTNTRPGVIMPSSGSDGQKQSVEIAAFTIRGDSIDSLIAKAKGHLELVKDDTDGD